jgi:predicted RND superfamily exporter protein
VLGVELSREMMRDPASSRRGFGAGARPGGIRQVRRRHRCRALPFAAGIVWTFGLYPAVGQFNIVNALSIPLILGIGIDYAVHFLSAIRSGRAAAGPAVDLESALARTGKAVFLSALTTMIGFGSLAFAGRFKGIADLGATLLIGIGCCLVAAVLVLPAAETFFHEKSKGGSEGAAEKNVREAI